MVQDEERPESGPEEEPGSEEVSGSVEAQAGESETPTPERREGGPHYLATALISAGVVLFGLACFMAGFGTHVMLDDDDGGGTTAGAADSVSAYASDDPAWGPEDAPVVIEEFADFQCPYCGRFAAEVLPQLMEAYEDRVRFVYRDLPLNSIHEFAQKAAEAGQCAHEQGRFWAYHNLLFANQDALEVSDLKGYAKQVGLNADEFDECLDSDGNAWEVTLDVQDAYRANVSAVPAILVNGVLVGGVSSFEQLQGIIDAALAAEG